MRVKLLEALSMGMAVVATPLAAQGFPQERSSDVDSSAMPRLLLKKPWIAEESGASIEFRDQRTAYDSRAIRLECHRAPISGPRGGSLMADKVLLVCSSTPANVRRAIQRFPNDAVFQDL